MAKYRYRPLWVVALTFALCVTSASGLPGALDFSFNQTGKLVVSLGAGENYANAVAVQPDGKIILAGTCFNGVDQDFCAQRFHRDGNPDLGFGVNGKVVTAIGLGNEYAHAAVVQPDGKIVLAGTCYSAAGFFPCAVRYEASGNKDVTFGAGGKLLVETSVGSLVTAAVLQPDNKLVLGGECFNANARYGEFCIRRFDASGAVDPTFGVDGVTKTNIAAGRDSASALIRQSDGKFVLAGSCSNGSNYDFCAARYRLDGAIDETFATGGTFTTTFVTGDDAASGVAIQPDGRLVLVGACNNTGPTFERDFCALRLLPNGSLDSSFGSAGKISPAVGKVNSASAVAIQPDGRILLGGTCFDGVSKALCVRRYLPEGTPDVSFGIMGEALTVITANYESGNDMALQADGKVLVVGGCYKADGTDPCAVRYEGGPFGYTNCSLDIDGDNRVLALTDSLIHARIALGITGPAVVGGISFASHATRNTWPLIRDYLVTQCGMSLVQ